jgi:hypothetical protein
VALLRDNGKGGAIWKAGKIPGGGGDAETAAQDACRKSTQLLRIWA